MSPTETLRNVAHSTRFNDIFSELLTASGHHAGCDTDVSWLLALVLTVQAERDMQVFALITKIVPVIGD